MEALIARLNFWFTKVVFNATREDFYKDLALAIEHDEPVAVFLGEEIAEAAKYKESGMVLLCRRMLRRMDEMEGRFSHMLETIVPRGDLFALRAIDEVDKVKKVEGLVFLADSVVRVREMFDLIFAALQTLITMLPVLLAFALINALVVVPEYEQMIPIENWPAIGKAIYYVSYAVRHFGILLAALVIGAMWAFFWSLDNWYGPTRNKMDKYLPYRLYRDFHGSIFVVRLAQLLKTDYSLNEALQTLHSKATPWMRWHILRILRNMNEHGEDYGLIVNTGVFSRRMQKRVSAHARRSGFRDALVEIGGTGIKWMMDDMKKVSSRMNKISLLLCFAGICFFHFGMQYTANDLISQMKQDTIPAK